MVQYSVGIFCHLFVIGSICLLVFRFAFLFFDGDTIRCRINQKFARGKLVLLPDSICKPQGSSSLLLSPRQTTKVKAKIPSSADEYTTTTKGNSNTTDKSKWTWNSSKNTNCNIERMNYEQLVNKFGPLGVPALYPRPIVLQSNKEWNKVFRSLTSFQNITKFFDEGFLVTLSSSNSFSSFRRTVPLSQYVNEVHTLGEVHPQELSNETWYLFGQTFSKEWKELLQFYNLPPCHACTTDLSAVSFGIGNRAGSGVQWHFHGPGFSETLHGRKHWVLYPPADKPSYNPDITSLHWMEYAYPNLPPELRPWECTIHPGELIYFPDGWYHATLNLDPYTAFVSTFTRDHDLIL